MLPWRARIPRNGNTGGAQAMTSTNLTDLIICLALLVYVWNFLTVVRARGK
jgi:hypothetical protein